MSESTTASQEQIRPRRQPALRSMVASIFLIVLAGCGSEDASAAAGDEPTVVVTTSIWADVVSNVACDDLVDIETIMPVGSDAHAFEPSLADRARFDGAALIVANGITLEVGLLDTIAAAEEAGTPLLRLGRHVDTIPYGGAEGHQHEDEVNGDEEDHEHSDDGEDHEHSDDEEGHSHAEVGAAHSHEGDDPHLWFDPVRVSDLLPVLADRLVDDVGLDPEAIDGCVAQYRAELAALHDDIAARVAELPEERRLLVTSHDTLGYFGDRYGFELIGTVSASPSGLAETNPAELEALALSMEEAGSRTIFTDAAFSTDEADALARRLGDAQVVTLYTESLSEPGGEAGTYLDLLATNADRILTALA